VTVAELRERLATVPDHYDVVIERQVKDAGWGKPKWRQYQVGAVDVSSARYGLGICAAFVLTAGCGR
jgi:hypothetical protein